MQALLGATLKPDRAISQVPGLLATELRPAREVADRAKPMAVSQFW
jgi:hypothetical protein